MRSIPRRAALAVAAVLALAGCTADEPTPPTGPGGADPTRQTAPPPGRTMTAELVRTDGGTVAFAAVLGPPTRDPAQLPPGYPNPAACGFDATREVLVPLAMHGVADIELVEYMMTVEGPTLVAVAVQYGGGESTCESLITAATPVRFGARWSNAAQPGMVYANNAVLVVRDVTDADQDKILRSTLLKLVATPVEEGRPAYEPRNCSPGPCAAGFPLVG